MPRKVTPPTARSQIDVGIAALQGLIPMNAGLFAVDAGQIGFVAHDNADIASNRHRLRRPLEHLVSYFAGADHADQVFAHQHAVAWRIDAQVCVRDFGDRFLIGIGHGGTLPGVDSAKCDFIP